MTLRKRQRERAERSQTRKLTEWEGRFDRAETPLDVLAVAADLLRTRLAQREGKAAAALRRARSEDQVRSASARLAEARADVERIAGEAAEVLARLAEQVESTTTKPAGR